MPYMKKKQRDLSGVYQHKTKKALFKVIQKLMFILLAIIYTVNFFNVKNCTLTQGNSRSAIAIHIFDWSIPTTVWKVSEMSL